MKAIRITCFALGTALLLAAAFLVLKNVMEDKKGGRQAKAVLTELKKEIPESVSGTAAAVVEAEEYDLFAEYEEQSVPEMQTLEIDGALYIGYISIPTLGLELPVNADWSYSALKVSPCRYKGNIYANDLIIAAHNYKSHFGRIDELGSGDEIFFTDVTGKRRRYAVTSVESIPGDAVENMNFGSADEWDLTIFTCTLSGRSRVTVRAERTED